MGSAPDQSVVPAPNVPQEPNASFPGVPPPDELASVVPPPAAPAQPANASQLPTFDGVPNLLASNMPEPEPPPQQGSLAAPVNLDTRPASNQLAPGSAGSVAALQRQTGQEAKDAAAAQKGIRDAAETEKTAIDAQAGVDRAKADTAAVAYEENRTRMAKIQANEEAGNAAYTAKRTQLDDAYNKAVADQDKFVFDPDQYINKMSIGSKIFTVIAIGLSGMGNSRSIGGSGENLALKGLNDSIQANVDAQKEQYKRLGQRVDRANNAYARARELHLDDAQATAAARQASASQLSTAIDTITARYAGEEVDARRATMKAHLESEGAKANAEFQQRSQAMAHQARAEEMGLRQANDAMRLGAANYNLNARAEDDRHNLGLAKLAMEAREAELKAQGKGEGSIPGWRGVAPTKELINKAAELSGDERVMDRQIQEIIDFKKEYGRETVNREQLAMIASTAAQLTGKYKDKLGLGVMSKSDEEFLGRIVSDPTSLFSSTDAEIARFTHLKKQLRADTDDKMAGYGLMRDRDYKGPGRIYRNTPKEGGTE